MAVISKCPSAVQRLIAALEPWYDWGKTNNFRLDATSLDDDVEGEVRYFTLQWIGFHVEIQFGRMPKAVC